MDYPPMPRRAADQSIENYIAMQIGQALKSLPIPRDTEAFLAKLEARREKRNGTPPRLFH